MHSVFVLGSSGWGRVSSRSIAVIMVRHWVRSRVSDQQRQEKGSLLHVPEKVLSSRDIVLWNWHSCGVFVSGLHLTNCARMFARALKHTMLSRTVIKVSVSVPHAIYTYMLAAHIFEPKVLITSVWLGRSRHIDKMFF